jgi:hypothetical protein
MNEKILEILKLTYSKIEELESRLHEYQCQGEADKKTYKADLLQEIDNFKKQAAIIFNARELHEQALLKRQAQSAAFFEDVFNDLELKFNNLTPLNGLEDVKKSCNTVVSLIGEDLDNLDSKISVIEKRINKVKNPFSILITSLVIFAATVIFSALFSIKIGNMVREINQISKANLIQSDVISLNKYFQNHPDKLNEFRNWKSKFND